MNVIALAYYYVTVNRVVAVKNWQTVRERK